MIRASILIFDWDWNFISQHPVEVETFPTPDQWDDMIRPHALATGRSDTHSAVAMLECGAKEIDVTPDVIAELRAAREKKTVVHTETWEDNGKTIGKTYAIPGFLQIERRA